VKRQSSECILSDVLSLPTAPFCEHHVLAFLREFVGARAHLSLREDSVGNLLVRYRRGRGRIRRPVCLTAHVDHPGFIAEEMIGRDVVRATWRGGVLPSFFVGSGVRFWTEGTWVRGRVLSIATKKKDARTVVASAKIGVGKVVSPGSCGMWDLPDPRIRGQRIHARAIDDLAGVAAMLACLDTLNSKKPDGEVYCLFTRAEEVGFIGAMAACQLKTIPKNCVVVAIETSSERSHARMGDGPILRVGDKASTFTSAATSFAGAVATDLSTRRSKSFRFQRKLMDGGTCESSAYCALGYDATGICLALGNYHNMNVRTGKIAAEFINLDDYHMLVEWFVGLSTTKLRYDGRDTSLDRTLTSLQSEYNPLLRKTARARSV
jgi:putative aminopeptidase FrvX